MLLTTVTNRKYFLNAINLIESYKQNSFNKEVLFYYFDLEDNHLDLLKKRYGAQIVLNEVEKVCDHAHSPRMFFYKVAAIYGASLANHDFIYSDSTNAFVNFTLDIKKDVEEKGCLITRYNDERLKNKYWVTNKCFEKMNCNETKYFEAPQYWAGFQCYKANETNKKLINDMHTHALDIDVIGPDTTVKSPDGDHSLCVEHRQDQAILSLLIEKYNLQQEYNREILNKYGDQQTLVSFDASYGVDTNNIVLFSRMSKFGDYRFIGDLFKKKFNTN
jgi:hypothetical protein